MLSDVMPVVMPMNIYIELLKCVNIHDTMCICIYVYTHTHCDVFPVMGLGVMT